MKYEESWTTFQIYGGHVKTAFSSPKCQSTIFVVGDTYVFHIVHIFPHMSSIAMYAVPQSTFLGVPNTAFFHVRLAWQSKQWTVRQSAHPPDLLVDSDDQQFAIESGPVEIVDVYNVYPLKHGDFPVRYVCNICRRHFFGGFVWKGTETPMIFPMDLLSLDISEMAIDVSKCGEPRNMPLPLGKM